MSEPRRWQDDDSSPSEVRDLLRSAKGAGRSRPLPAATRARSAARIDRMLALPAAAGLLLWLKGVAVAAGIGVLGVVAVKGIPALVAGGAAPAAVSPRAARPPTARSADIATPSPAPPATAVAPASAPAATASATAPAAASTSAASVAPPRAEPTPSAEPDSLAREAAMLDRARALLDSDPDAALAVLDEHAAAFPSGSMSLERELLAVEALRRLQRVSEARARGTALLQRARGSIYEDRVRAILDALPSP